LFDQKSNKKIKPAHKNLKNYFVATFRAPSRSPCRLNSWSAATLLRHCFLRFF